MNSNNDKPMQKSANDPQHTPVLRIRGRVYGMNSCLGRNFNVIVFGGLAVLAALSTFILIYFLIVKTK